MTNKADTPIPEAVRVRLCRHREDQCLRGQPSGELNPCLLPGVYNYGLRKSRIMRTKRWKASIFLETCKSFRASEANNIAKPLTQVCRIPPGFPTLPRWFRSLHHSQRPERCYSSPFTTISSGMHKLIRPPADMVRCWNDGPYNRRDVRSF